MTMAFTVKDDWVFEVIKPGDHLAAAYVVDGTNSWLEEVVLTKESSEAPNSVSEAAEPKPGQEVPNYRLANQDGDAIRIHDYKGKSLLLTFIFTRCQDPDQCTLMSSNFATIQSGAAKTTRRLQQITPVKHQLRSRIRHAEGFAKLRCGIHRQIRGRNI